ncbi:two-component system, NarL family, sensor histidine kinase EvgS [Thermoflexales bacterium]|nr:two-component system, NarL family, sensor histidine kinase EvgS [Thermoflexales bacterium]
MSEIRLRAHQRPHFNPTMLFSSTAAILVVTLTGIAAVFFGGDPRSSSSAPAQDATPPAVSQPQPMRFTHPLNIGAELSYAILQDRDGFLWLGTGASGLIRYDGYAPQFFTAGAQSVSSNSILALLEDRAGLLWIATRGGGLNKYDKQTNTFTYYRHDPADDNSLSSDSVNVSAQLLFEDQAGHIWIGTDAGLDRLDRSTETFMHYRHDSARPNSLSSNNIFVVLEDNEGLIWVGTDVGLDRLDPRIGEVLRYQHDPANDKTLGTPRVTALHEDSNGVLWIGGAQVLDRFDKDLGRFTHYRSDPANPAGLPPMMVTAIDEAPTGELFLGTFSEPAGLVQFDRTTGTFTIYKHDPTDPHSLSSDMARRVFTDRSGIRWIVHGPGMVDQYDPQRQRFTLWQSNPANPNSLSNSIVVGVYEDSAGIFWIATVGGLNRYDPQTETFTHYLNDPTDPTTLNNSFALALLEDNAGNFWVSTFGDLCLFDRAQGRCAKQVDIDSIYGLIEDSTHPGQLWLGSFNQGIYKYDVATGQAKQYAHDPDDPNSLANNTTWVLKEDKADPNILWVPTQGGGLDRFDKTTESFTHYRHNPEDSTSSGANQVFDVYEDQAGNFWVGTGGGGLNKFDKAAGTFQRYNKENHFPTNEVRTILEDVAGNLWLGTDIGLIKFDPRTGQTKVYDVGDGLQGNSFLPISRYTTRAGEMWFGGVNGVNRFFPEQITANPFVPPIYLTTLSQDGEPLALGPAPERLTSITLKWPKNFFEFEYVALNYTQPEKNQYAYQLEGIDNDWYAAGTRRFGRYANLPGGTYTLHIKGSNNDGVWNETGVDLSVIVVPPFWDTGWFRALIALLVVGLVFGGFRYRTRSLRQHARQLEQEVAARTHELTETNRQLQIAKDAAQAAQHAAETANQAKSVFLANMSHELRTPLNAILGYAQLLQRDRALAASHLNAVNTIERSSQHLLTLINDILDLSKIEAGRQDLSPGDLYLPSFLQEIASLMYLRANQKGLGFTYQAETALPHWVQADEKRLRQVLINLLSNAIKFTDRGEVTFHITVIEPASQPIDPQPTPTSGLRFEVIDTGVGIAADQLERIFLPFEQASDRPQYLEGTGLGLAISRQLVRAMGSDIHVTSEVGRGSTFWFELGLPLISKGPVNPPAAAQYPLGYRGPRRTVLIVDDQPDNRLILIDLLQPLGFDLHEAADGQQALEAARDWKPDLILMDMFLPALSGFEVTPRLRQMPELAATIIIGVSAGVSEADTQHMLQAGCHAALSKPVDLLKLLAVLASHFKLEWVYSPVRTLNSESVEPKRELIPPASEELAILYDLARRGNLQAVQERAAQLAKLDEKFAPFANQVSQLVRQFEDKALVALIQQYLEKT